MKTPRSAISLVDDLNTPALTDSRMVGLLPDAFGLSQPDSMPYLGSNEILFVDANVEDISALLTGLSAGVEVLYLNDQSNVLDQIVSALVGRSALSAIHIVSHGAQGQLAFANGSLQSNILEAYRPQL